MGRGAFALAFSPNPCHKCPPMKRYLVSVLSVLALGLLSAPAADQKVIKVGTRPESITKGFGGLYYITVMGEQSPGDATVRVLDGDTVKDFATGLDEPKGICFTGKHLVTTDVKKVWKIDAKGEKSLLAEEKDFPKSISYLNDAAADGKTVYVTDMGANTKMRGKSGLWDLGSQGARELPAIGCVYKIAADGKITIAVDSATEMSCPNGVSVTRNGQLLIGEFFFGNILLVNNGKFRVLTTGLRGADGVEQDSKGNIYVSSWTQGKVWKLDKNGYNSQVLIEGMQSSADFYLDEKGGRLMIPDMLAGTITILPLK
jgi:hypothetical protein